MRTVVISGYYGYENLGDEALLSSIITALRAELRDIHIIVLSAKPEKTSSVYGVEAVNRVNIPRILVALKRADLLISGGGSLLQDVTGSLTIPYYLGIVTLARMLGKPVMFYAQGIGPINGSFGKLLVKLIVNKVDIITLRDSASARLLREMGVNKPSIEITADPVFGIDVANELTGGGFYQALGIDSNQKPLVGFFIREWQGMTAYKKALAELADYLYETNRQAVFVPMQYPRDLVPVQEITGLMSSKPLIIEQAVSFPQLLGLVSTMELVVGMRLHALIVAALSTIPMIGLSYDPKVSEFLDGIEQPVFKDLGSVTSAQLIGKLEETISNREAIRQKLGIAKKELKKKALRNSRMVAELLGS